MKSVHVRAGQCVLNLLVFVVSVLSVAEIRAEPPTANPVDGEVLYNGIRLPVP